MIFIDDYPLSYKHSQLPLAVHLGNNTNNTSSSNHLYINNNNTSSSSSQTPISPSSTSSSSSLSSSSPLYNSNSSNSSSSSNFANFYHSTLTNIYTRGRRSSLQNSYYSGGSSSPQKEDAGGDSFGSRKEDDDDKKMNIYYGTASYNWWLMSLLALVALVVGALLIVYFQPNFVVRALSNHFNGEVVFFSENRNEITTRKLIALTIDDAPSRDTEVILDIFEQYNVKATFFLIGKHAMRSEYHQRLLDRALDQGHEIGNHMWRDEPSINLELDEFERQLVQVEQIINQTYQSYYQRQLTKQKQEKGEEEEEVKVNASEEQQEQQIINQDDSIESSTTTSKALNLDTNNNNFNINFRRKKLFRPGSGWFNRKMLEIINRYGYTMCLGNVYPHDPFIKLTSLNSWYVTTTVSPGSVIILHDRDYTAETLQTILPQLISEGYTFVTLSHLLDIDEKLKQTEILNSNNNNNNNNNYNYNNFNEDNSLGNKKSL